VIAILDDRHVSAIIDLSAGTTGQAHSVIHLI
jgi:hypothetical protein